MTPVEPDDIIENLGRRQLGHASFYDSPVLGVIGPKLRFALRGG